MSKDRRIPIKNKNTGATSFGSSVQGNKRAFEQSSPIGSRPDADKELSDTPSAKKSGGATEADASGVRHAAPGSQDDSPRKRAKKPSRAKIETVEQFIAHAYARRGQRVGLTPAEEKLLCRQPRLDDAALARLFDLAAEDVLLSVPRQLLLACRDIVGFPMLGNVVREFVGEVLARHPIFGPPALSAALKNLPDSPELELALTMLAKAESEELTGVIRGRGLKPKALQELQANATYCLAVWFIETRGIGLERVNRGLFAALWRPAAEALPVETDRLRCLTEVSGVASIGLAAGTFKQQADAQASVALTAVRAQEALQEQRRALDEQMQEMQAQLLERDKLIAAMEQRFAQETQNHEHTRIHLKDDYEQLRTRLLRRLKAEVVLLTDGLHALRRDPPKIRVMDDHAERALEGLKREIRSLESED